jgi:hypothetical protein
MPSEKRGHNSNLIFQPLTVSTSKCRENPLPQLVTALKMLPFAKISTRCLKQPLEHYPADRGVVAALT